MYSYIKGKVTLVRPKYIVLENNGIGYEIIVSNPYNFKVSDESIIVYTYYFVREDNICLYGFETIEQKDLFLSLISVSGVGPKSALSIIASASVNDIINAINNKDALYLKKFPGVGTKSSQQIILDLCGKIDLDQKEDNTKKNDFIDALLSLGYSNKEIIKVLDKIDLTQADSIVIKQALRLLNK